MEKSSNKTLNKNREIKIDKLILNISVGMIEQIFIVITEYSILNFKSNQNQRILIL